MRNPARGALFAVLLLPLLLSGDLPVARAQEADGSPAGVVILGNTRFTPLFEEVTLAPGERVRRSLRVAAFTRVSLLAAAESAPNDGRVAVVTIFGPPAVPVRHTLNLAFDGGSSARGNALLPVAGPRLTVEVANLSLQPVQLSLSVFATK